MLAEWDLPQWLQSGWGAIVGNSFEWRDPWLLFLALGFPLVLVAQRRLSSHLTYSSTRLLDHGPRSLRARLAHLPAWLLGFAYLSLVVAIAGPRSGEATAIVKREGIAIMLVIDRSATMDARDFVEDDYSINRLAAVKRVVRQFVLGEGSASGRPNDLIGVVAFGTYADAVCPLTLDHANLTTIVDDLSVARERGEGQTAVGEGLALAVERLRAHPAQSKVVVLLTDGVNNAGDIEPLQAAELAKANDITVHTVGAGTTGIAPVPVRRGDGREYLRAVRVEIDERMLEQVAASTGGHYFHARDAEGLERTYREIDELERSEITEVRYYQYDEHYRWWIALAGILVLTATVATGTVLRRLP